MNAASDKTARQYGPWPGDLESLVAQVRYRAGWTFSLQDDERDAASSHGAAAGGLTLTITTLTANSYDQRICEHCRSTVAAYRVRHLFPVPAATYGRQAWLDWLMDCVEAVELHEAREFFRLEWSACEPPCSSDDPSHMVRHEDWPWQGTKTSRGRQIGNAIPPQLAAAAIREAVGITDRQMRAVS